MTPNKTENNSVCFAHKLFSLMLQMITSSALLTSCLALGVMISILNQFSDKISNMSENSDSVSHEFFILVTSRSFLYTENNIPKIKKNKIRTIIILSEKVCLCSSNWSHMSEAYCFHTKTKNTINLNHLLFLIYACRYRQTRFSSRRVRKRVIFKHGDCNVVQGNVAKRRRRYMQDIFTTLVDAQWRWTILIFAMSFILTWAGFAGVWYIIAFAHGDIDYADRVSLYGEEALNETHIPCVTEVKSFASSFLFSVETQHTIGYGNRYTTPECPEAIFTMCIQCILGVFIQAFMVGIVFAKLSRPKKRAQTLLYSRNAVICHRDGVPCLMFRVGDMRKSHIIEAHVRAQIIRKKVRQPTGYCLITFLLSHDYFSVLFFRSPKKVKCCHSTNRS